MLSILLWLRKRESAAGHQSTRPHAALSAGLLGAHEHVRVVGDEHLHAAFGWEALAHLLPRLGTLLTVGEVVLQGCHPIAVELTPGGVELGEAFATWIRVLPNTNLTIGTGSPTQGDLDAEWQSLVVRGVSRGLGGIGPEMVLPSMLFTDGTMNLSGFDPPERADPARGLARTLGFGQVTEITETKNQDDKTVMYCEHILLVEMKDNPDDA